MEEQELYKNSSCSKYPTDFPLEPLFPSQACIMIHLLTLDLPPYNRAW